MFIKKIKNNFSLLFRRTLNDNQDKISICKKGSILVLNLHNENFKFLIRHKSTLAVPKNF